MPSPRRVWTSLALAVTIVATCTFPTTPARYALDAQVILRGCGIVETPDGVRMLPGRTLADPDPIEVSAADRALLAGREQVTLPFEVDPAYRGVAEDAVRDLDVLVQDNGAVAAGWPSHWHYHWPRDAAFVSVAYSMLGRPDDALAPLDYTLSASGGADTLQARYLLDGSGDPPDDRGVQLDGSGWTLWALWTWSRKAPADEVARELPAHEADVARLAQGLLANIGEDGLPVPSPDYWEVPVKETTLGTAAPVRAGLAAAADLLATSDPALAARARTAAETMGAAIEQRFGPAAQVGDVDASAAMVLPPFWTGYDGAQQQYLDARTRLAVPVGGIKPGTTWRDDYVSWTPETALFALTAAGTGHSDLARSDLDFLTGHVSECGALPEKVNREGQAAGVAPLAWTDALYLTTLAVLAGEELPTP